MPPFGAFRDFNGSNNQLFAALTLPIDTDKSLSFYGNRQPNYHQGSVQLTKNLPLGNGYGYHLTTTTNQNQRLEADLELQNQNGFLSAIVDQ